MIKTYGLDEGVVCLIYPDDYSLEDIITEILMQEEMKRSVKK